MTTSYSRMIEAPRDRWRGGAEHHADRPRRTIPTDDPQRAPEPGTALCLSGGGYRAMVFHIGVLWRLYEAGLLGSLKRISSVSGGSITAGVLALKWRRLSFDPARLSGDDFVPEVVAPVRAPRRRDDRRRCDHPRHCAARQGQRPRRCGL